jgi:hypothetical protein
MITYNKFQTEDAYNSFRYKLLLWTEETGKIKNCPYLNGRVTNALLKHDHKYKVCGGFFNE